MVGGNNPMYLKFWVKLTAMQRQRRFSTHIWFASQRLQRCISLKVITMAI